MAPSPFWNHRVFSFLRNLTKHRAQLCCTHFIRRFGLYDQKAIAYDQQGDDVQYDWSAMDLVCNSADDHNHRPN